MGDFLFFIFRLSPPYFTRFSTSSLFHFHGFRWKEDETDDEDFYTGADENHQNDSGEVEDSRADLDDWFRNCDEPDDDIDEDEDEGYAQSPLHF